MQLFLINILSNKKKEGRKDRELKLDKIKYIFNERR